MLPSQRSQFDIPDEVTFLDAAARGPLSRRVRAAGGEAMATRGTPWKVGREQLEERAEEVRGRAAELIDASANDIALVTSVSHAIAIAARSVAVRRGTRILRLAGEHPSNALEWSRLAQERGAFVEILGPPRDGDWTSTVLEAIAGPAAAPLAVVALTPVHWSDGARLDLDLIAPAARRHGAALVIDATHTAGAVPLNVRQWQPDFLAFPSFKWLLGPYSMGFLYASPAYQGGEPLERNAYNSRVDDCGDWTAFAAGARRYDMGERGTPITLALANAALEQHLEWGSAAVSERLAYLTALLARHLEALGMLLVPERVRAPHMLGARPPTDARKLVARLARDQVFLSERQGVLRFSPHVYNDEADIERAAAMLRAAQVRA
jgi:selenocysteine lyase/cysteine desulfurase